MDSGLDAEVLARAFSFAWALIRPIDGDSAWGGRSDGFLPRGFCLTGCP
jgi:hypothetical protein